MSNFKSVLGIMFMIAGTGLCMWGLSTEPQVLSESDLKTIDSLKTEIRQLTERDSKLGDVNPNVLAAVSEETSYNEAVHSELLEIAQSNGLTITDESTYAKANEANIKKTYYSFEGYGDIQGIVQFLQALSNLDRALLVESVALREPTELVGNFQDSNARGSSGKKSFSLVIEDSHKRDLSELEEMQDNQMDLNSGNHQAVVGESSDEQISSDDGSESEESKESLDSQGMELTDESQSEEQSSSGESDESKEHEHVWGEVAWKKAPTHEEPGIKIRVCSECKDIEEFSDDECDIKNGHDFGNGECGKRTCSVCGYKETEAKHKFGPMTVYSAATCDQTGWNEHTCVECGFKEQVESPMIPHNFKKDDSGKMVCEYCGISQESAAGGTTVEVEVE